MITSSRVSNSASLFSALLIAVFVITAEQGQNNYAAAFNQNPYILLPSRSATLKHQLSDSQPIPPAPMTHFYKETKINALPDDLAKLIDGIFGGGKKKKNTTKSANKNKNGFQKGAAAAAAAKSNGKNLTPLQKLEQLEQLKKEKEMKQSKPMQGRTVVQKVPGKHSVQKVQMQSKQVQPTMKQQTQTQQPKKQSVMMQMNQKQQPKQAVPQTTMQQQTRPKQSAVQELKKPTQVQSVVQKQIQNTKSPQQPPKKKVKEVKQAEKKNPFFYFTSNSDTKKKKRQQEQMKRKEEKEELEDDKSFKEFYSAEVLKLKKQHDLEVQMLQQQTKTVSEHEQDLKSLNDIIHSQTDALKDMSTTLKNLKEMDHHEITPLPVGNSYSFSTSRTYSFSVPKLTKPGYTVSPSIEALSRMSEADLAAVPNFSVERAGVGKIEWDGAVDVRGVDLDQDIMIDPGTIKIYNDARTAPPVGTKLNRFAVLSFYGVHPTQGTDATTEQKEEFIRHIHYVTEMMGGEHILLNIQTGVWKFRVKIGQNIKNKPAMTTVLR